MGGDRISREIRDLGSAVERWYSRKRSNTQRRWSGDTAILLQRVMPLAKILEFILEPGRGRKPASWWEGGARRAQAKIKVDK